MSFFIFHTKQNRVISITAKALFLLFIMLLFSSYAITFKEQYYNLYHVHYQQYPDDVMENIYWLERAVAADFANPQYALTHIKNEDDWEKYRYLFMMHVNLKLIEQHMRLGRYWDKQVAYFYDAPWKEEYLRDLETARSCYVAGLYYWKEAKLWAEKANQGKFYFINLSGIQNMEDESFRINTGDLNYERILEREIKRVDEVIADLLAMNESTY